MSGLMQNLKIAHKLALAFGALLLMVLVLAGTSLSGVRSVNAASGEIVDNWLPSTQKAGELATLISDHRRHAFAHVTAVTDADMTFYEKGMADLERQIVQALADYAKMIVLPQERALHGEMVAAHDVYMGEHRKVVALSRAQRNVEAQELLKGESRKAFYDVHGDAAKLVKLNADEAGRLAREADDTYRLTLWEIAGITILALVLAGVFLVLLRAAIAPPIAAISAAMGLLAGGNKGTAIPGVGRGDELGGMAAAVQVFKDNMIRADAPAAEQEAQRAAKSLNVQADGLRARITGFLDGVRAA